MRLSHFVVAAAIALIALHPLPARADSNRLLWECRYALDSPPDAASAEHLQAGMCLGYVSAVLDASAFYESHGATPAPLKCLPDEITVGDAAKAVRDYLEAQPAGYKEQDELVVTIRALQAAYPCAKGK